MRVLRSIPALFVLILVACGVGNVNISISPDKATMEIGSQMQFSASVGNAGNKVVTWSATGGTVDSTGLYTAPGSPGTSYVVATSQADPSRTATAVITVVAPVMITPTAVTLAPGGTQTFTAIMPATGDTNMNWSVLENAAGGTAGGTITTGGTTGGNYTAPINAADTAVFHIVATSQAYPSKSATALVTIQTPVVVLPSTASIKVGTTQQFTATVRANPGTSVTWTWSVLENAAGGTAGGTIDNNGLYTAPAVAGGGPYHVVATNPLDTNQTGRATVTVTP
jgi:hypothetical protein